MHSPAENAVKLTSRITKFMSIMIQSLNLRGWKAVHKDCDKTQQSAMQFKNMDFSICLKMFELQDKETNGLKNFRKSR